MVRIRLRRVCIVLLIALVGTLGWFSFGKTDAPFTKTCNQTELFQKQLHVLTEKVHRLLRLLNLNHFLCYNTLWGQIRLSRTLPWVERVELCLLNEQIAAKDEVFLLRFFRKSGLNLEYDSSAGQYVVTAPNMKPSLLLIVFELDELVGMYRRIGWTRRVLPPDCENLATLDCFPPRLVVPPLPLKQFGPSSLPVPRENIEIQKYHYRNSWWKETVQFNC